MLHSGHDSSLTSPNMSNITDTPRGAVVPGREQLRNQLEDHGHYFGNHWFSGGFVPDTHVVGKPALVAKASPAANKSASHAVNQSASSHHRSDSQPHYHDFSSYLHAQHDADVTNVSATTIDPSRQSARHPLQTSKHIPSPFTVERPQMVSPPTRGSAQRPATSSATPVPFSHPSPSRTPQSSSQTPRPHPYIHDLDSTTFTVGTQSSPYYRDVVANNNNISTGIPRGFHGLDNVAAAARRSQRDIEGMQQNVARTRKAMLQQKLREDLDKQIMEKQQRKYQEWAADAVAVYGPALALDDTNRRLSSRHEHRSLQQVWKQQAAAAAERKAQEDAYYKPAEENWNDLKGNMDRLRHDDAEARVQTRQNSWLEAWKDHQATEGELRKAAAAERYRQEQLTIAPHIANYSDRILLAEQQKRDAKAAYGAALDAQVADRTRRKYSTMYEESH